MTKARDLAGLGAGFTQTGTGAVQRTVENKLNDVVSVKDFGAVGDGTTDDTSAIQAAINHCVTSGATLSWPKGSFKITANLTSIHTCKHVGEGAILNGSDTFYPAPFKDRANTIYVATTGVATNDGLSASRPVRYQDVNSILYNYGPVLGGKWVVQLAAGTYSVTGSRGMEIGTELDTGIDLFRTTDNLSFENYLTIQGPDVGYNPTTTPRPTPTAVFDGNNNATALMILRGVRTYVKDLKFINANGSASSNGISADVCELVCLNVHTDNCYYGISGLNCQVFEVRGGDIDGNSLYTGIRSIFLNKHSIGYQGATDTSQGPFIHDCATGFFVQEGCTGHCDWVQFTDCGTAIRARVNSRVNCTGSNFDTCSVGIDTDFGSVVGFNDSTDFNLGTASATTTPIRTKSGGAISYFGSNSSDFFPYPTTWSTVVVKGGNPYFSYTGGTGEQVVHSLTIPPGFLANDANSVFPGKRLKVRVWGTLAGTSGSKIIRLRLGDTNAGLYYIVSSSASLAEDTGSFVYDGEIMIYDDPAVPITGYGIISASIASTTGQTTKVGTTNQVVDTSRDSTYLLRLTAQLGNAADTININGYTVEVSGII